MFYFFLLLFISKNTFSQHDDLNAIVDSLRKEISKQKNDSLQIDVYNKLSLATRLAIPDSSILFAQKALKLASKVHLPRMQGIALTNLAGIESNRGNYETAIQHFFRAAAIFDSLKSIKGLAAVYANIAGIHAFRKEYAQALTYQKNALQLFEQLKDTAGMIYSNNQIGNVFAYQNKHSQALPYYQMVLRAATSKNDSYSVACVLGNIASCQSAAGKYDLALIDYLKSVEMLENLTVDKINLATVYANVGDMYARKQNYQQAITYINKGLALAQQLKHKRTIKFCYELLAGIYANIKQYKQAFEYYQRCSDLKDSLLNEDSNKSITEMQTKYEAEKKQKEIELLNKDKLLKEVELAKQQAETQEAIVQRNSWIVGALALVMFGAMLFFFIRTKRMNEKISMEKQLLELEQKALSLQMNPHFIFNSINSISSFISQNNPIEAKRYLSKFAKLMRLILDNSRESLISIKQEAETLNYYLELEALRFNNKFCFEISIDENIDVETLAIPPMLIQPQVENAILHGILPKEKGGLITIRFYLRNQQIICEIKDNGVGRKRAKELKLITDKQHKSLGMQVTKERLEIISEKAHLHTSIGIEDLTDEFNNPSGTKVVFTLPMQTL